MSQSSKRLFIPIVVLLLAVRIASATSQITNAQSDVSPITGVFEGITPCTNANRPVLQIPEDAECEMMIWHLKLEQDPATGEPTTYTLDSAYGMSQPNTNGIRGGGTPLNLVGTWIILRGTATNPDATVYQLNPHDSQGAISFVSMDDSHLHVLTQDLRMAVGNGGWSYTLNRTDQPPMLLDLTAALDAAVEPAPVMTTGNGSDLLGVFDGRTPCVDLVYQFTKFPPSPACMKIKWRLHLFQDPGTGVPTTYRFQGTETTREGSWSQTRGTAADPNAIVYQLAMDDDTGSVLNLLRADENNLLMLDDDLRLMLGDRLWSYTFSRVEPRA